MSSVLDAIKEAKNSQVEYQRQVSEFMHDTTNAINALCQSTSIIGSGEQCWFHKSNGHDIQRCSQFARLSDETKLQALKENNICFSCLNLGHTSKYCPRKIFCEIWVEARGRKCGRVHHPLLHDAFVNRPSMITMSSTKIYDGCCWLLVISKVTDYLLQQCGILDQMCRSLPIGCQHG